MMSVECLQTAQTKAGEMAEQVKVLDAKPDSLRSISGTHMVRENW